MRLRLRLQLFFARNRALCSVGRAGGNRTAVVSGADLDSDATSCTSGTGTGTGTKEVATHFGQASSRPRRAASLSQDGKRQYGRPMQW